LTGEVRHRLTAPRAP